MDIRQRAVVRLGRRARQRNRLPLRSSGGCYPLVLVGLDFRAGGPCNGFPEGSPAVYQGSGLTKRPAGGGHPALYPSGCYIMNRRAFLKSVAGAGVLTSAGALATPAISQRAAARVLRFVPQA